MMFYLPKDVFVDWWIINTSFCIFLLVSFLTLVDSFAHQLAAGFYINKLKKTPAIKKLILSLLMQNTQVSHLWLVIPLS